MSAVLAPDRGLQTIRDGLRVVGYDAAAIIDNYDFTARNGHTMRDRADLVAFSDAVQHDLQTSCIAAYRITPQMNVPQVLERLSFLAVPLAFMADSATIDVWAVKAQGYAQRIRQIPYDQAGEFFTSNERSLRPESVRSAKSEGRQLSFFEVDPSLYRFAADATQKIVVEQFENSVSAARQEIGVSSSEVEKPLTRFALQLLAAAILEDKQGEGRSQTARSLIERFIREGYGEYFNVFDLDVIGDAVADVMHEELRRDITFRSFTNMMLAYLYENTFVPDQLRRDLGIYYTPHSLARRIFARLPVESIPPDRRTVLDGTCGSGSLLFAAHERLTDLLPAKLPRDQIHSYLLRHIHGVDLDPFAVLVSRLALFLTGVPASGKWDINVSNFLELQPRDAAFTPTIIVGNPPFREENRLQAANDLFLRYLDWLPQGGFLGIILPETFLENKSCREARRRLRDECEPLEIWHLPEGMFPSSNVATIVLLVKKRASQGQPMRVEWVARTAVSRDKFLDYGMPTYSFFESSQAAGLTATPLERTLWSKLTYQRTLGDIARVRNGIKPGRQGQEDISSSQPSDEWKPWLSGASSIMPYFIRWSGNMRLFVRYPGHLDRPRPDMEQEGVFATSYAKVLVNANRAPDNPWKIYASIDDVGFYPSNGLHCIIPRSDVTLEELAALLNSPIASLWVYSRDRSRYISKDTLEKMPLPPFTTEQRASLHRLVHALMKLRNEVGDDIDNNLLQQEQIESMTVDIDEVVFNAFGMTAEMRHAVTSFLSPYGRPGLEWMQPTVEERPDVPVGRGWTVTGQVLHVDPSAGTLHLWVSGYNANESFDVEIPELMPGWALREGASFRADIPWESRNADFLPSHQMTNYRSLDLTYLPTDRLADIVADPSEAMSLYSMVDATRR